MGKYEVLTFLIAHPNEWFNIKELAKKTGISERNTRRSVLHLEGDNLLYGRCRGNYVNWNREFKLRTKD